MHSIQDIIAKEARTQTYYHNRFIIYRDNCIQYQKIYTVSLKLLKLKVIK
jgi:hypothetical protein